MNFHRNVMQRINYKNHKKTCKTNDNEYKVGGEIKENLFIKIIKLKSLVMSQLVWKTVSMVCGNFLFNNIIVIRQKCFLSLRRSERDRRAIKIDRLTIIVRCMR